MQLKPRELIEIALLHAEASTSIDDPALSEQFRKYRQKRFGSHRHDTIMQSTTPANLGEMMQKPSTN